MPANLSISSAKELAERDSGTCTMSFLFNWRAGFFWAFFRRLFGLRAIEHIRQGTGNNIKRDYANNINANRKAARAMVGAPALYPGVGSHPNGLGSIPPLSASLAAATLCGPQEHVSSPSRRIPICGIV
jgi:hypothetical protein